MRKKLKEFVEKRLPEFHQSRIASLESLKLVQVLERKNPYLFRAKNSGRADELVGDVLDAFLSSKEETVFGSVLESIAIEACRLAYGGRKSSAEGIDLEFETAGVLHIVSIKSGSKWGNSQQIKRMRDNFKQAKRILGTNTSGKKVVAINGCCYGREGNPDKGDYLKLCGEAFWTHISGDSSLYVELIEPIGHQAKQRNEAFGVEYDKVRNRFTKEFMERFCAKDGGINWPLVVELSSAAIKPKSPKPSAAKTLA